MSMKPAPKHAWAAEHKDGVVVEGCPFCRAERAEATLERYREALERLANEFNEKVARQGDMASIARAALDQPSKEGA